MRGEGASFAAATTPPDWVPDRGRGTAAFDAPRARMSSQLGRLAEDGGLETHDERRKSGPAEGVTGTPDETMTGAGGEDRKG